MSLGHYRVAPKTSAGNTCRPKVRMGQAQILATSPIKVEIAVYNNTDLASYRLLFWAVP
jgi:hypothetical protein